MKFCPSTSVLIKGVSYLPGRAAALKFKLSRTKLYQILRIFGLLNESHCPTQLGKAYGIVNCDRGTIPNFVKPEKETPYFEAEKVEDLIKYIESMDA